MLPMYPTFLSVQEHVAVEWFALTVDLQHVMHACILPEGM